MKPYIICETAYNHEGDFNYLERMINEIGEIGVGSIKFHLLVNCNSYLQKEHPLINEIKKWMFTKEQWDYFINLAKQYNLDIIALCDDIESLYYINKVHNNIKAIELHSSSLNDYFMLREAAKFKNQVILGIGGSTLDEIQFAIDVLKDNGKEDIFLMYGFQSYPTDYNNINLSKLLKIKDLFCLPIGYADHTAFDDINNIFISSAPSIMGINILEKHYTLDVGSKRIDYQAAVGKRDIIEIYKKMELYLNIFGDNSLKMSHNEINYGNIGPMKKAIVAKIDISKGDILTLENLWYKRTESESTIRQMDLINLLGLETIKDIKEDEIIDYTKINYKYNKSSYYELTGGLEKE